MHASRRHVRCCPCKRFPERAIHAQAVLKSVRGLQRRAESRKIRRKAVNRNGASQGLRVPGIQQLDLMKPASIQQKRGSDLCRGNSVVEESGPTTEHRLRGFTN